MKKKRKHKHLTGRTLIVDFIVGVLIVRTTVDKLRAIRPTLINISHLQSFHYSVFL